MRNISGVWLGDAETEVLRSADASGKVTLESIRGASGVSEDYPEWDSTYEEDRLVGSGLLEYDFDRESYYLTPLGKRIRAKLRRKT